MVARLRAAGAIPVGKTNLDQFATGLVGVRTPYPAPRNALDPAIVPGGSSSGSAVAVAHGLVAFALGTDTAGSGRVPAGLNNIVGLKPTPRGALDPGRGAGLPDPRHGLDLRADRRRRLGGVPRPRPGSTPEDPYSRPVPVGPLGAAPPHPADRRADAREPAVLRRRGAGGVVRGGGARRWRRAAPGRGIDFAPFYAVAEMLYDGAWVAERQAVVGPLLARDPEAVQPVIRQIVEPAAALTAVDAFRGFYRLEALRREVAPVLASVDLLCVPTIPTF